jgi:two-component system CheB/CheR fusion protein
MPEQFDVSTDSEDRTDLMRSSLNFPVVGLGASAGGLEALLRFLENMPAGNGMAFIIILHLSPQHESNAAEILQRSTSMPVVQVDARTAIEADHVYVIPPSHDLAMNDGHLELSEPTRINGMHLAIDLFFRTLAQVHQERAVAIVMSGTGADGAVGLARVKEQGGITMAQSPEDAQYDGMPKAAIGTSMVDFVLNAVDMPQRLMALWANARRIRLPKEAADPSLKVAPVESVEGARQAETALHDIMALLRSYSKNDFRHYKRATVLRRIERRLQVNSLPDLPAYRDYLREHPQEAKPLLQDMLISVTNFFRDPEAFEALEREVLPSLLENRPSDEPLRVWVAGCATGEEAYSLTMLLREQMALRHSTPELQVFATDIDERAIGYARNALYPASILADVSPGRLRQFFIREQDQYRVVKAVREKVLFAEHNVLRDPPFSRMDLICCRNLLIYLDRDAQSRILEMFRFALKPGGYLFLGTSESTDAAPNLFTVANKKSRIFKVNPQAHAIRHLPLLVDSPLYRTVEGRPKKPRRESTLPSVAELHRQYIDQVISPSVLLDSRHNVLHLSDKVGKFLLHSGGTPSVNLLANVQSELRTELRTALFQVSQSGGSLQTRPVALQRGDTQVLVQMTVRFFGEPGSESGLTLVMFDELAPGPPQTLAEETHPAEEARIHQLETEIRQLKEQLQDTIEQAEHSTEALRASNEELQAINEELRSASEELETSKEELQSINEELTTVNFELKVKVDETSKINDDLQNLIASSEIATVFIDRGLHIKRYTPQAASIFNLIASDVHRSLLDITHRLDYESLANDVAEVFKSLNMVERHVSSSDGKHYLARIRPYRTIDDRIDGAVLTFVDVTALRRAEEKLRAGEERLRIAAETTKDYAILTVDDDGLITTWNLGAQRMFGYEEKEVIGQNFSLLFTPEDRAAGAPEEELRHAREDGRSLDERWHLREDGSTFFCSGVVNRMEGKAGGFAKIARDMTESKAQEASRDEQLALEQQANELKDQFLAVMSHELKHPLNLIQVNAELLISQPEVRALPAVARAGYTIRQAVASQAKIIDDLLDLSRVRTGKLTLTPTRVELNEVAALISAAAQDAAQKKGLRLTYDCSSDEVIALCDRVRTEQIFWNLINNAIKFTPTGGSVALSLEREETFARFTVSDTGQGIAPEFLPEVFGMFKQGAHQPSSQNAGLGVGLTLVRDLAVAQGGRVLAESQGLGQGSSFTIWLPLANRMTPPEKAAPPKVNLTGLWVLAVDDMLDSLEPFADLLRLEGANVDIASSGQQALDLLQSKPYDVLISDIGMDGMDGYELIREVRKRPEWSGLQAIALSGFGRQVDVSRALRSGFNAHLAKPASVAHICQTIAQLAIKPKE